MKAEDINVGMWLRYTGGGGRNGQTFRVESVNRTQITGSLSMLCTSLGGAKYSPPLIYCEPWVPRVGEWVRLDTVDAAGGHAEKRGKVGRVNDVKCGVVGGIVFLEGGGCGLLVPAAGHYHVEPCLPPEQTAVTPSKNEAVMSQPTVADQRDANGTCTRCGGPAYLGLQEARCLAPKCEAVELEPCVEEDWIMPAGKEGDDLSEAHAVPLPGTAAEDA